MEESFAMQAIRIDILLNYFVEIILCGRSGKKIPRRHQKHKGRILRIFIISQLVFFQTKDSRFCPLCNIIVRMILAPIRRLCKTLSLLFLFE